LFIKAWGKPMRYFFHIYKRDQEILDFEGTDLCSDEAAHDEAWKVAAELKREFLEMARQWSVLEVFNDLGARVIAVPIGRRASNPRPHGAD